MNQFLLKVLGFSVLVMSSMFLVFSLADGTTDAMYLKFTTPKQNSLILGSSRAAQGIQPKHLNSGLNRLDLYNYSFQIPSSPYGEVYLKSIKKKVNKNSQEGVFILEVNPWTLCTTIDSKTKKSYLSEKDGFLENTNYVNVNPNIEYLVESLGKKYADILRNRNRKGDDLTYFIENDGWLHVNLKMDSLTKRKNIKYKVERYRDKLSFYRGISEYRILYLSKTIKFLKQYGKVYLVRVPVIESLLEIENELAPEFDDVINGIASKDKISYINMMPFNQKYGYTDGNHLDVASGRQFSIDLADRIKALQKP